MLTHAEKWNVDCHRWPAMGGISVSYGVALHIPTNPRNLRVVAQKVYCSDKHPYMAEMAGVHALLKVAHEAQRDFLHSLG